MKTIKDIITGKKDYSSGREYVDTQYIGGENRVMVNKIKYLECKYPLRRKYRRLPSGERFEYTFRYFYTYEVLGKRYESPMFETLTKMNQHKQETLNVVMGVTTIEG